MFITKFISVTPDGILEKRSFGCFVRMVKLSQHLIINHPSQVKFLRIYSHESSNLMAHSSVTKPISIDWITVTILLPKFWKKMLKQHNEQFTETSQIVQYIHVSLLTLWKHSTGWAVPLSLESCLWRKPDTCIMEPFTSLTLKEQMC